MRAVGCMHRAEAGAGCVSSVTSDQSSSLKFFISFAAPTPLKDDPFLIFNPALIFFYFSPSCWWILIRFHHFLSSVTSLRRSFNLQWDGACDQMESFQNEIWPIILGVVYIVICFFLPPSSYPSSSQSEAEATRGNDVNSMTAWTGLTLTFGVGCFSAKGMIENMNENTAPAFKEDAWKKKQICDEGLIKGWR